MKAGYQGKPDAMRDMAEKLMDHPGHAKDVYYSKSCADKETMRPFKEGGHLKTLKHHDKECCDDKSIKYSKGEKTMMKEYKKGGCATSKPKKMAAGGIGKVRHDQATMDGKQLGTKKCKNIGVYY